MSGTLLEIVQDAMAQAGFRAPTGVASNPSDETQTLLRLANRVGNDILKAHNWQQTQVEGSITLVSGTQTYSLPSALLFYSPETMWNRDTRRPVLLALTPSEWQYYKGWVFIQGLNLRARIQDSELVFEQTIDSSLNGNEIYFEYRTKAWVDSAVETPQERFILDTDICRFDRDLMSSGLLYRIKQQRGLDYQQDKVDFEIELRTHMANDNAARTVKLAGPRMPFIGVNVPDGNFAGFS
jgi:hypothetical protein